LLLTAANAALLGTAALFYLQARRRLLRAPAQRDRPYEFLAVLAIGALGLGAFALANAGMTESWTGKARLTGSDWVLPPLLLAAALLGAHALLVAQRSRVDEFVLPVAGLLCALGLVNVYVWETRDANSYVSTVALPVVRDYQQSLRRDASLEPAERMRILATLGAVPNELTFEEPRRSATVLEPRWLAAYNGVARRYAAARALHRAPAGNVREVDVANVLRKQVAAAVLAFLSVPILLAYLGWRRRPRVAGSAAAAKAAGLALLVLLGAALLTSRSRSLPALLEVGGHGLTVFEPLKVALVVALALGLSALASARGLRRADAFALAAAVATIGVMLWRDFGAGIALLAVAALMSGVVVRPRWRRALAVTGVLAIISGPALVRVLDVALPDTARVRMEMWVDPWGAYERAALHNKASAVLERLVARREREAAAQPSVQQDQRFVSISSSGPRASLESYVDRIERELRWRLEALDSKNPRRRPLIPRDPDDPFLLGEAEKLWADLGGFRASGASAPERTALRRRVEDQLGRLRQEAERRADGRSRRAEPAPDNFQLQRSLYALRKGGVLGVGLGRGRPEMVPGLTEDVAVAALGEALGTAGIVLVGLFMLLLIGRGFEVAGRQHSVALRLLALGLATLLGLQALISLGGVSGLLPFTGLTFPLLSRSGTALLANLVVLTMLLAVASATQRAASSRARGAPARLRGAGFPAAFAVAVGCVALVPLTGRTVASGALLERLPGPNASFLHANDQWDVPTYRRAPGPILARDGSVLAETRSIGAPRTYPDERLARGLGHPLLELDASFRGELSSARRPRLAGPALVTTIDPGVQRAIDAALAEGAVAAGLPDVSALRGAVVVLDVRDGGIVALQSRPSFAPAELIDQRAWSRAEASERRAGFPYRYLHRVVDGFYPPGSIFKTITAAGALERGLHTLYSRDFDYRHGSKGRLPPDGVEQLGDWHQLPLDDGPAITDGNHPNLEDWHFNLEEAFAWSCNVAFAELGLELGPAELIGFAQRFGFERPLTVRGLGTSMSTLDNDVGRPFGKRFLAQTRSNLARTAFGQGQARVTPLQMALVPAAIANGGKIMQPRLVAGWRDADGRWLRRERPSVFSDTRLSPIALAEVQQMMRASVTYGWAHTAAVNPENERPGVAGKTGSAEWSEKLDVAHAWFIGYFPAEAPRLAVAVVVERGGAGPTVAARIARRLFADDAAQEYVRRRG
jgi:penicillin-binding protein A